MVFWAVTLFHLPWPLAIVGAIAAVFGGIGSIQGAVIGGLMLGFVEILVVAFFPDLAGYRDAFAFILLIFILLFKPTGLFGAKLEDKV